MSNVQYGEQIIIGITDFSNSGKVTVYGNSKGDTRAKTKVTRVTVNQDASL